MTAMKKLLAGLMLAATLALTACSDYTGDAVVEDKSHSETYVYYTTVTVDKSSFPVANIVPESWSVQLRGADGESFSIDIDEDYYDWVEKGRTVRLDHGEIIP